MSTEILQAAAVSFAYGKGPRVIEDLSLELSEGEICALLGPNGSGKTTYLRILCGLNEPESGVILLRGREIRKWGVHERAKVITYVPSELYSDFPITSREVVSLGRNVLAQARVGLGLTTNEADRAAVEGALHKCGCLDLADRLIQELSHGQRQLVAMARAIAQESKILAIDETFSKMDLHHQVLMGRLLQQLAQTGKIVLWVVHDFNLALEFAHTCLLLKNGRRVASGKVSHVISEEKLKRIYPTLEFSFTKNPLSGKSRMFFN